MEKHVTFVAVLNIALGFLGLFLAALLFVVIVGAGIISGEAEAMTITSIIASGLACFLVLTSLPEIIGGFGLLKRKAWARILILVVACLDLLWIPIGTMIGIYELWVLLNEETVKLFAKETHA